MKYVFFGTPRFAEIVLRGLIDAGLPPVAVIANPDRPVGRKKILTPPPTKVLAAKNFANAKTGAVQPTIEILQPEKIDEIFIKRLRELEPDFAVVAAYAKILPKTILDIPRLGTLGVHPSLLPKFRGASPIQSAILAGDAEGDESTTGATIYLMDEKTDHGPILAQEALAKNGTSGTNDIGGFSYLDLEEKLANLSAKLLIKTIPDFLAGKIIPKPQDKSQATYTKKFTTQDAYIAPEDLAAAESGKAMDAAKKAADVLRKINAFNPEPGAWTKTPNGKRLKLLEAKLENGRLRLKLTQEEGAKPKTQI